MKLRTWDATSSDEDTWEMGNYWTIHDRLGEEVIGFVVICPFEIIPHIWHRHWHYFPDNGISNWDNITFNCLPLNKTFTRRDIEARDMEITYGGRTTGDTDRF